MSEPREERPLRSRLALAVIATVLAMMPYVVLPTLLGSSTPGTAVAMAGLALALAALLVLAVGVLVLGARSVAVAVAAGEGPPPVLAGRATDPVHHPLRPRAPGLA